MAASGETGAPSIVEGSDGLRILHVMRAPVGGLFRHVVDLARSQAQSGASVGVVVDANTGGPDAEQALAALAPSLTLGLTRLPMHRLPHPDDLRVAWRVARLVQTLRPDIVHGHGAKGGLYTRLPALLPGFPQPSHRLARVYTPHGGSLHFHPSSPVGRVFMIAERIMGRVTDLIPFESDYARRRYVETVGEPRALSPVVRNGLAETEFEPVEPDPDAADFLFVGEMRYSKGVDTLLEAFARLEGRPRLTLIGSGADEQAFRALANRLGVAGRVAFLARMDGREAFRQGRILVSPSRAESLPYVVLEAIAAKLPIVASNVGGVCEIFGEKADRLIPADDADALAAAMRGALAMTEGDRRALAARMAEHVHESFTLDLMTEGVLRGYRDALRAAGSADCLVSAPLRTGD